MALSAEDPCELPESVAVLVSPDLVIAGDPVRVLLAYDTPLSAPQVSARSSAGACKAEIVATGGGPPFWVAIQVPVAPAGRFEVRLGSEEIAACVAVAPGGKPPAKGRGKGAWTIRRKWERKTENLYSAWFEHLFLVPEGTSWRPLHQVLRDPARNLLINHLGLAEDDPDKGLRLEPDCADNPYTLRAYFSWKLGLPFAFSGCDRGGRKRPPACTSFTTNLDVQGSRDPVKAVSRFLRMVAGGVHSASARTRLSDDRTDLYPVALRRDALRPGTVFADPYGHTLTLVRFLPQQANTPGTLLAVDAQPDGTVAIKRFWRGNFLFVTSGVVGEPGFKAFRPVVQEKGKLRVLTNKEIAAHSDYGFFSLEQQGLPTTDFFDRMERIINPIPLDPESAYRQLHQALYEQLLTRVQAVENGELYHRQGGAFPIPMPTGLAVFQTSGAWEDFSTPSRDMRLLIAMDSVLDFPERVVRTPDAFALPAGLTGKQVQERLVSRRTEWWKEYRFEYVRSDGSRFELSLADLFARATELEMGYNPNDCPEVRWGAPAGSTEASTCKRRLPADQLRLMKQYRTWFSERRRPSW